MPAISALVTPIPCGPATFLKVIKNGYLDFSYDLDQISANSQKNFLPFILRQSGNNQG
jgi:hypothetical protein